MVDRNCSIQIRQGTLADLPSMVAIHNHYVLHTHSIFDVSPYTTDQRVPWFHDHCDGKRYQMLVACEPVLGVVAFACTGRHRAKEAYDTTVESSVYCHPDYVGRGLGSRLYRCLFKTLEGQDIHRIVAGIAQPNEASNALHRKLGFQRIGVYSQVGRKFGKYWDVLWMERALKLV